MDQLVESLQHCIHHVPSTITPPDDGVSLFDTKNELFLAYLQNLVFLILLKLRSGATQSTVEKLVELRLYLEKGVRPLESKLQYQLDKLLAAASAADSKDQAPEEQFSHRPNPAALVRDQPNLKPAGKSGVYKPPRITPTALPTTDDRGRKATRPRKSQAVDAFIREELTDAPIAEPSIGAGNGLRGRERERAAEREAYEEQRLMRLPEEKKNKGRRKRQLGDGAEDLEIGARVGSQVDFGSHGRRRAKSQGKAGKPGEAWAKRLKKGVRGRRA